MSAIFPKQKLKHVGMTTIQIIQTKKVIQIILERYRADALKLLLVKVIIG